MTSFFAKVHKIMFEYNAEKTRPKNLFMQSYIDHTFWTYASMNPEDVIAHSGFDTAMSHAFITEVKQDKNGRWSASGEVVETYPTKLVEAVYRILSGGNYNVVFDPSRVLTGE